MPQWAAIVMIAGAVGLIAALSAAALWAWRAFERQQLLMLIGRLEAVEAAAQALTDSIRRLSEAADDELQAFADDPTAPERRVLAEIQGRARILCDELDHIALPGRLVPIAEAIADAAYVVNQQAACITDTDTGEQALSKLADVDIEAVTGYVARARTTLGAMCAVCGLEDTAVYGGGLYL